MLKEFREFALKGNLVDIAVGLILGAAFGAVAKSLVDEIIMPPIGMLLGGVDFTNLFVLLREGATPGPYASLAAAREAGAVAIGWGAFLNVALTFLITAWAVFLLVKGMNKARRQQPEEAIEEGPTPDQALLAEIRDLLRSRQGA
jgi:large conductance mechanosensitive channel